jgi:predicted transposase YbfD/YdcC
VELTVAPELLAEIDLKGRVVTFDALHTQRKTAERVLSQGGDYLMVVKENQPGLYADIKLLFDDPPPGEEFGRVLTRTRHGDRYEERELWSSTALNVYLDWPGVGQVCRRECRVTQKGQTSVEVRYAVTSLASTRAQASELEVLWRGHWSIENRLHWERDVVLGEDLSQVRTGSAPEVMAALRNLTLALLRIARVGNIAATLRRNARYPHEALALMGWPYPIPL